MAPSTSTQAGTVLPNDLEPDLIVDLGPLRHYCAGLTYFDIVEPYLKNSKRPAVPVQAFVDAQRFALISLTDEVDKLANFLANLRTFALLPYDKALCSAYAEAETSLMDNPDIVWMVAASRHYRAIVLSDRWKLFEPWPDIVVYPPPGTIRDDDGLGWPV